MQAGGLVAASGGAAAAVAEDPGASVADAPSARVAVSRSDFDEKLRGRSFNRWRDFKETLGPDAVLAPDVGGEVRLMSGLTIAFIIILNVVVFSVVALILMHLAQAWPRAAGWAVFGFLCFYGAATYAYCQWAYSDPEQRVITNFLFGMVPLAVSSASYVLALMVLDACKALSGEGWEVGLWQRCRPWEESFPGRLIFLLAVLPGLALSIYLGNTVSTGFKAAATHFDVLSLCLFVDVGRFAGHLSYLAAREWSIGKSPLAMTSRPGLCYVFLGLCLAWYVVLARLEAGQRSVVLQDETKIHTLACLTSYVFFPLSLFLVVMNHIEFFEQFEQRIVCLETASLIMSVLAVGVFMLLVGVVFDAIEPNLLGIAVLLWAVFYSAVKISSSLLAFILALLPLAALAFGAAVFASQHAVVLRGLLLAALAPPSDS